MDADKKEALRKRVMKLNEGALDDYVHDLKNEEAATINNGGLNDQFDYLAESGGLSWLEEIVDQLSPEDED